MLAALKIILLPMFDSRCVTKIFIGSGAAWSDETINLGYQTSDRPMWNLSRWDPPVPLPGVPMLGGRMWERQSTAGFLKGENRRIWDLKLI